MTTRTGFAVPPIAFEGGSGGGGGGLMHAGVIAALALAFVASTTGCQHIAAPPLAAAVERAIDDPAFSGAVVLTRHGQIVYERALGWADREAGRAFTLDTAVDGASLAKTFTAAALELLAARDRLSFDDPVVQYVQGYPHAATRVRHLLQHSAGLPDYEHYDAAIPPGTLRTTEAMLALLKAQRAVPAFEPGTAFEYSSPAYDVAALVLEQASGCAYEACLRELFFTPLSMHDTFVRPAFFANWPAPRTIGHRERDGRLERFDVFDGEGFHGGCNLYFSARDLSRWAAAFAMGTLPAPVLHAAIAPRRLDDGRALDLTRGNWCCNGGARRCQYSGHLNAFHSVVHWDRERGESVVWLSNNTIAPWRHARITRELVAALAGLPAPPHHDAPLERIAGDALPALQGTYRGARQGALELRVEGGRVRLRGASAVEYTAFRVAPEVFYVPGRDIWLGFSAGRLVIRSVHGDEIAERE
jgi:CubicO group peptidase (beta-lactamase class C family)